VSETTILLRRWFQTRPIIKLIGPINLDRLNFSSVGIVHFDPWSKASWRYMRYNTGDITQLPMKSQSEHKIAELLLKIRRPYRTDDQSSLHLSLERKTHLCCCCLLVDAIYKVYQLGCPHLKLHGNTLNFTMHWFPSWSRQPGSMAILNEKAAMGNF